LKKSNLISTASLLLLLVISIISCVDPFEIKYDLNQTVLIVDAVLTDELGSQNIIIKSSSPNPDGTTSYILPFEKAKVEILVNGSERKTFIESSTDPGNYQGPDGFRAIANNTYQLIITTSKGKIFQSTVEKLIKGSAIKSVYQKLQVNGKPIDKNFSAKHNIYLDTEDPAGKGNNYSWQWRLIEKQEICRTCELQERYYPTPYPGRCVKDLPNFLRNTFYDYQCDGDCYEILHNTKVNIMNDDFSDGKVITARLIAEVPVYQINSGAVIEIKQQSLSLDAYKYLKILIDQNQNSGGLADTPPVSLIGNISSIGNDKETVAGFFRVVDESKYIYWIDRSDLAGIDIRPVGLLGGRATSLEPSGSDTTRPPYAPCIEGYNRTKIRPVGWQDTK
jgi:Domain of unknown function (DUF4249)